MLFYIILGGIWPKLSIFLNGNIRKIGATLLCLALLGVCFYLKAVLAEEYPPFSFRLTCSSPAPPRSYLMGADTNSIAEDFASLQDALNSGVQQRILSEYVKNPFLDDDVHALALRTGMVRQEVGPVLAELRHAGLLQSAGRRGHMLDAQAIVETSIGTTDTPPADKEAEEPPAQLFAPLLDALSCGVALIDINTGSVEANQAFSRQLDLPTDGLNAECIADRLECDLHLIAGDQAPVLRALENGVSVELRSGNMGPFSGLIAVVNIGDGAWEISKAQVQIQEDLFAQLREEIAHPAEFLQSFLEKPKKSELGQARAAIERIHAFLALYLLDDPSGQPPLS